MGENPEIISKGYLSLSFAYIRSEKDILKLVNTIIVNTKGEGQQASEDFWVKAEKLYYTALIAYIWYEAPEEEQNFSMLIDLVDASEAREDDENFKNAVDLLFEELEQRGWPARYEHPFHIGVTIGVHTGPTPIGVGLLRRENCPPESKKE